MFERRLFSVAVIPHRGNKIERRIEAATAHEAVTRFLDQAVEPRPELLSVRYHAPGVWAATIAGFGRRLWIKEVRQW